MWGRCFWGDAIWQSVYTCRYKAMTKASILTVQKWGNSLAVRIPSAVARSAGFKVGQPVDVSVQDSGVLVTRAGEVQLTLAEKLALFDPALHGGEVMQVRPLGKEVL